MTALIRTLDFRAPHEQGPDFHDFAYDSIFMLIARIYVSFPLQTILRKMTTTLFCIFCIFDHFSEHFLAFLAKFTIFSAFSVKIFHLLVRNMKKKSKKIFFKEKNFFPRFFACYEAKFKYAPLTSCEVERTSSLYKQCLRANRRSFKIENFRKHVIIACNNRNV